MKFMRSILTATLFLAGANLFVLDSVAATFTVTTTNDTGASSLRQAILDANANAGPDAIAFNIASPDRTISPATALPTITDGVSIDGTTQPGFAGTPIIEINGASAGSGSDGLRITSGNCTIRGLVINRFNGDGIELATGGTNVVENCYAGLNLAGTLDQGNNLSGVFITNSANNIIGGVTAAVRNFIAGNNQHGVHIGGLSASNNVVIGNVLGLGTNDSDQGNSQDGVRLNAPRNRIGGSPAGERNIISGNSSDGIELAGTNATANAVQGNYIGTDPAGGVARANNADGILISGAPANIIGGTAAGEGNLISGNFGDGIELNGANAAFNQVLGNRIGIDANGALPLANFGNGVQLTFNARSNVIGGIASGAANLIAFHNQDGVFVNSGTNNAIRGNSIHSNGDLGIDLGASGVTANEAGDGDTGPNQLQNFPLLSSATYNGTSVTAQGTLNSRANTVFALDFFANAVCDASGNGEGQVYLGSTNVTTDGGGNISFTVTFAATLTGRIITATATDPNGNTSEFSPCVAAASTVPGLTFTVVNTNDTGAGSLRQAILDANAAITAGDTIAFNIPGAGPHTIAPAFPLPALTDPGTTIDGCTQPGASPNTLATGNDAVIKIRLHGGSAGFGTNGLRLASSNNVVRGLCMIRFNSDAIGVATTSHNVIEGNFIGIDVDGTTAQANTGNGVFLNRAFNNRVGGTTPAARNLISGNSSAGVGVQGPGANGNVIQGNLVGVNVAVTLKRGNANGVTIFDADNNRVGGAAPGAANVLAGGSSGVSFAGSASNNVIQGNFVGTDPTGTLNLGNTVAGIAFTGGRGNAIGGTGSGEGNVIAFNGVGVTLIPFSNATNDAIRGNAIHSSTSLGIDLGTAGVTTNDLNDADTGPNFQQNFPVLTAATNRTSETIIHGALNGRANTTYALDFFANLVCDTSGHGEGMHFVGSTSVTTDGSGNASFSASLPVMAQGRFLTATATDPTGNTSEFSACREAVSEIAPGMFQVTNTNDTGPGSLRQALLNVNTSPSAANFVTFNIPGAGPHTIALLSALPTPTQPVTIDGLTQPGASANTLANGNNAVLLIRLDGASAPFNTDGLRLSGSNLVVRGLILSGFKSDGIELVSGGSHRVEGNVITNTTGNGVTISGAAGCAIGGATPAARNVISANTMSGVNITGAASSNNIVQGNFVGTDVTGTLALGNRSMGVSVANGSRGNRIGGTAQDTRNVISGNSSHGVSLSGASSNVVQGNFIGTDASGTAALSNFGDGVNVSFAPNNLVGGTEAGAGNVISGNRANGVQITGGGAVSNRVQGNFIGTDVTGANPLSNTLHGVRIDSFATDNRIGGSGNVIAFNGGAGVLANAGTNNAIRHNAIFDNVALGIDLAPMGVTTNDLNDTDSGVNFLQNFPSLTAATANPGNTVISGTLNSRPNATYALDFFSSPECDDSGHGEGKTYLGATNVMTDGSGNVSFVVNLPVVLQDRQVTATATDPNGNTSEFSPCLPANSTIPAQSLTVMNTNDDGPGSLRRVLLDHNQTVSASNNTISFNIPGPGPHVIRPLTPLPPMLEPATMNGFTESGSSPNTSTNGADNATVQIVVDGSNVGGPVPSGLQAANLTAAGAAPKDGFVINADGSIVKGITWQNHTGNGFLVVANRVLIQGVKLLNNALDGVRIDRGSDTLIGGPGPADRCVLRDNIGNGASIRSSRASVNTLQGNLIDRNLLNGVLIASSSDNHVKENHLGTNLLAGVEISGTAASGNVVEKNQIERNLQNGARIDRASNNRIGRENFIFRSEQNGVEITGTTALFNVVEGNRIELNIQHGVNIVSGSSNTVGGSMDGAGNVIGSNDGDGVRISGGSAGGNVVVRNQIGLDPTQRLANGGAGVSLMNSTHDNIVGPQNEIANNRTDGVLAQSAAVRNRITANSIFSNVQLGIDLDANEVTPNDGAGDPDFGANLRQNFPILNNACWDGSNLQIFGELISAPNTLFQVEFFLNSVCDPSLHGEGEKFIGVAPVMTDNSGRAAFTVNVAVAAGDITAGSILTCTATDPTGNTSEFSPCFSPIQSKAPGRRFGVVVPADDGPGSFRDAIRRSNAYFASNRNEIVFALKGPGPYVIALQSALPAITQAVLIDGCNQIVAAGADLVPAGDPRACKVIINGLNAGSDVHGLQILPGASGTVVRDLTVTGFSGHGIGILEANNVGLLGVCGLTNLGDGIRVVDGSNNRLGGTNGNELLQLFGNGGPGASVYGAGIGNSFYGECGGNGGLGFDLLGNGVTPNDAGDADTGPNNLQNFPALNSAFSTSSNATVKGTFQGRSTTVYTLTFYTSAQADPSGHGEGEKHFGIEVVRTDANGLANFTTMFSKPALVGHFMSATATCPDNGTSEFGRNVPVGPGNAADLGVTIMGNTNRIRLGSTLICSNVVWNFGPADATGVQGFFLPPCVEIVSFTASQGSASVIGEQVVWNVGTIIADAIATLVVTSRPTNVTTISNTFTATATQPDPNMDNNTMIKPVEVLPALPGQADLSVNLQSDKVMVVGGDITSTIGVNNTSSNAADNVMLMVILPHGAQLNFGAGPVPPRVSTPIEKLVNQIFMDLAGRPASLTELSSFAAAIVSGSLTPFDLATSLINGTAYRAMLTEELYDAHLDRRPTSPELSMALSFFGSGGNTEGFIIRLLSSDEFVARFTDGTIDDYIDELHDELIDDEPTSEEREALRDILTDPADPIQIRRQKAVRYVLDGRAYCRYLAEGVAIRYGRYDEEDVEDDDPPEIVFELRDLWRDGAPEEVLIAHLMSSEAYSEIARCVLFFDKGTMPGGAAFTTLVNHTPTRPGVADTKAMISSSNDPNPANNKADAPTIVKSPALSIQRVNGAVMLEWSAEAVGFTPEATPNLSNPIWTAISAIGFSADGLSRQVTLPLSGSQQFFRLNTEYPDWCLRDASGATLAINRLTGEFCFTCPDGTKHFGKAKVRQTPPRVTLEPAEGAAERLQGSLGPPPGTGQVTLNLPNGQTCTIMDEAPNVPPTDCRCE